MADVLLVCMSDDAAPAEALAQRLEAEGHRIDGVRSLADAWGDCAAGVVLWSPASVRSGAFLEVAHAFVSARKAVIVSILDGLEDVPESVDGAPFISLAKWDGDAEDPALDQVCDAVERLAAPSWRRWLSIDERQPDFVDMYMARYRRPPQDEQPIELVAPWREPSAEPQRNEDLPAPPPVRRRAAPKRDLRVLLASAAIAIAALSGVLQTGSAHQAAFPTFGAAAAYAEPAQVVSLQEAMAERVTLDAAPQESAGWSRGREPASMPMVEAPAPRQLDIAPAPRAESLPAAAVTETAVRPEPVAATRASSSADWLNRQEAARLRDLAAIEPATEGGAS